MDDFKTYMEADEKVKYTQKRHSMHVGLVKKYASKIAKEFPELKAVVAQAKNHDKSKTSNPEFDAYVEINWFHHQKDKGVKLEFKPEWMDAVAKHVKGNSHHPEYHDPNAKGKNYDAKTVVDATKMPEIDMAEMCADLCAMSKELGGTPQKFYKDNVNKRWKFTAEQKMFMMNIFDRIW
jgi:hypothetical protein